MSDSFAAALRAEIDAVVGRYEALVKALAEMSRRDTEALRADAARLQAENERLREENAGLRAEEAAGRVEVTRLTARIGELERALAEAAARADRLERDAQAAMETTAAYESRFAAEKRFVEASREAGGSLLGEALVGAIGRALEANSATYAALKAKGLEGALVAAVKERGRSSGHAPLLERERSALAGIAAAAGCELLTPGAGTSATQCRRRQGWLHAIRAPSREGGKPVRTSSGLRA